MDSEPESPFEFVAAVVVAGVATVYVADVAGSFVFVAAAASELSAFGYFEPEFVDTQRFVAFVVAELAAFVVVSVVADEGWEQHGPVVLNVLDYDVAASLCVLSGVCAVVDVFVAIDPSPCVVAAVVTVVGSSTEHDYYI